MKTVKKMAKNKKRSIRRTLNHLDYPIEYKKFSKIFKIIKKSERRYFIKLLKVICKEIKNKEIIEYATYSKVNLNQHGMLILLTDRLICIHSREHAKTIHFDQINYRSINDIDVDEQDDVDAEDIYGTLYLNVERKNRGTKNYKIRGIKRVDLPHIAELIRMKMV